jgi:hypothetical protein
MSQFSEAFLLLFVQLSIGGLLSLCITPFHELGQGFYKSTGTVFFCFGVLSIVGRFALFGNPAGQLSLVGIAALSFFVICFALYLFSLWRGNEALTAWSYALSFLSGVLTLVASGLSYQPNQFFSYETPVYALGFVFPALSLGSVVATMLLGHWYLIDPGISIEPFRRLFRFFLTVFLIQIGWDIVTLGALQLFGSDFSRENVAQLLTNQWRLFLIRLALAQVGTLVLCFFIWKTLQIPHTMAATGLLYIAVLFVSVAEILGKWLLALTSVPV